MRFTVADVPGADPRRPPGQAGSAWSSCATSSAAPCWLTSSTARPSNPGRDPLTDLDVIEEELAAYVPDADLGGRPLAERTRIVVLNKADVPEARELAEMVQARPRGAWLRGPHRLRRGPRAACASSRSRIGRHVTAARADFADVVPPRIVLRPRRGRRLRVHHGREERPRTDPLPGHRGSARRAGSGRPTSPTTRPSATSPTGSAGWASRSSLQGRAPSPATPCSSARPTTRSSSTGSRRCRRRRAARPARERPAALRVAAGDPRREAGVGARPLRRAAATQADLEAERRAGHWATARDETDED